MQTGFFIGGTNFKEGAPALKVTITRPDGFSKTDELNFGDGLRVDAGALWGR